MFKPVKGPKEGRLPPGLLYSGSRGSSPRRFSSRQVAIVLAIAFCVVLGYFAINSDAGTISSASTVLSPASDRIAGTPGKNVPGGRIISSDDVTEPRVQTGTQPKVDDSKPGPYQYNPGVKDKPLDKIYQQPATQPSVEQIERNKQEVQQESDVPTKQYNSVASKPQGYGGSLDKSSAAPARESWSERPQFEKALSTVINMLPDEVHMRELIRPVEGSGKEKMREMGLRTRAYRKYFDAWENLHMTTDSEGATYIRDDVVQYLRGQQSIKSSAMFSEDGVDGLNLAQAIRSYEAYRSFLLKFANLLFPWTAPYFSDHMSLHAQIKKGGRGIVLTAGDDQAPYLLTTIYSYRQLGCTLPIEVMYLGEGDLGEDYRAELEALPGVVTRDIAQMTNDAGWKLAGWAAKPFAILLSSFREVIFIDADSLFFKNPEILFEEPDYIKTGALFFKDRLIMPESKKRWLQQLLPKPIPKLAKETRFWTGESGHQQESGVVVVDKWKHFVSMLLITRFNGPDRDGNKENGITGVYDMVYGDKETFWIGFLLAGDENYAFHKGDAGIMGKLDKRIDKAKSGGKLNFKRDADTEQETKRDDSDHETERKKSDEVAEKPETEDITRKEDDSQALEELEDGPANHTICAPQLLHLDTSGKPLWFNGWLLHNKFAEKNKKRFAQFEHYLIEPKEVQEPGAWQLAESNMCCLTVGEERTFAFSDKEKKVLDMIMRRAEEMGMGNQS